VKPDDAERLKGLERENATPKRLLADAELEKGRTQGDREGNLLSPEPRRAAVHHLMRTLKGGERGSDAKESARVKKMGTCARASRRAHTGATHR